jgi:hypothetical protein
MFKASVQDARMIRKVAFGYRFTSTRCDAEEWQAGCSNGTL